MPVLLSPGLHVPSPHTHTPEEPTQPSLALQNLEARDPPQYVTLKSELE